MTRSTRRTPTAAPPLTERIRAAITGAEWHSLSALDALASTRAASDQRRAVHAALRELRAGGMVLEERVGAGGVEVRAGLVETPAQAMEAVRAPTPPTVDEVMAELGVVMHGEQARAWVTATYGPTAPTLPAPVPDDCHGGGLAIDDPPTDVSDIDPTFVTCPICEADPGHPCPGLNGKAHPSRHDDAAAWATRLQQEAERAEEPRAPAAPTPGPGARCASCDTPFARHATADHPFAPRKRGAPSGARQRRAPGPTTDAASEQRIERAGGPRLAPVGAEGQAERRMRAGAAPTPQLCGECWVRHAPGTNTACSGWRAFTEEDAAEARARGYRMTDDDPPDLRMGASGATAAVPPPTEGRCTPPACHYDRINDPARVPLDKLPPLCAAHRARWRAARAATVQHTTKGAS